MHFWFKSGLRPRTSPGLVSQKVGLRVVEVVDVVVAVVRVAVLESNGKLKPDQWFRQHPNVQPGYLKLE